MAARPRKAKQPIASNAVDIAFEAVANDKSLDSPARQVLLEQVRLARAQRFSELLGAGLKVLTGVVGAAAAGALAVMAWQASRANGVVIEPFAVPPALAEQGYSGQAIAAQVLDELAALQALSGAETRADDARFSNQPQDQLRVAIPATGVSLGELQAALRHWLGHETHVTGELYRTAAGLTIRARTGGGRGLTATGTEADVEALVRDLARAILKETKPVAYAALAPEVGERIALLRQAATLAKTDAERRNALFRLGIFLNQAGNYAEAARTAREALRLAPNDSNQISVLNLYESSLGHSEISLAFSRRGVELRPRDRLLKREARDPVFWEGNVAIATADYGEALRLYRLSGRSPLVARYLGAQIDTSEANALVGLHQFSDARAVLAAPRYIQPGNRLNETRINTAQIGILAGEEDWEGVLAAQAAGLKSGLLNSPQPPTSASSRRAALARVRLRDPGADALLAAMPLDCDVCVVILGQKAAQDGDVATSEHWFSEASRMAPSFPQASLAWGRARLDRGDLAGAIVQFQEAQKRSPRFADPIKFEADALARQNKLAEAVARYAAAETFAPKWGGLHLSWGEALAKLGKAAEAQAQWKIARGLDLTPAERARLIDARLTELGAR